MPWFASDLPRPAGERPPSDEPADEEAAPTDGEVVPDEPTEEEATPSPEPAPLDDVDADENAPLPTRPPEPEGTPPAVPEAAQHVESDVELALELGFYSGGVQLQDLDLVVGRRAGIGLHARQALLQEPYATSVQAAAMGSYHLAFFPHAGGRLRPIYGLGVRSWCDVRGVIFGFDAMLGARFRLAHHGVGRVLAQLGTLGRDFVLEARATLGYRRRRYEIFGGYSHTLFLTRSGTTPDRVSFGGALAGLRFFRR